MKKPLIHILLPLALLMSLHGFSSPKLNSLPSAAATIYLDFDGYDVNCAYWNNAVPFHCETSGMTDDQITEVYNRVAEDYRPFDVNITTDEAIFLAAPLSARTRIVITPTSSWCPGVGGISWIGSFTWGDDTPAFVFSDRLGPQNPKMVAECCSHESGHTVGLSHQSRYDSTCNLTAAYNEGEGAGEASWAPIMGNSYYRNMSGWNNGPTPWGCADKQDNLSIITTQNGFGYRVDDYSDDIEKGAGMLSVTGTTVTGIISTNIDKDAFIFTLSKKSTVHINISPFSVNANYSGANLDVKMSLYNSSHQLIKTYDPASAMNVTVDTVLGEGSWFLLVDGGGNSNIDDYGSLGSYTISAKATSLMPAQSISLTGKNEKDKHILHWDIISNEPVRTITVESSADGIHFNTVNTVGGTSKDFIYKPFQRTDLYYRIKVTSVLNNIIYSNTIILKSVSPSGKPFIVSTFIQNEITVDASEDYHYLVSDVNGNMLARGNGRAGLNKVAMSIFPDGMYVLQLLSKDQQQTERIIKQ